MKKILEWTGWRYLVVLIAFLLGIFSFVAFRFISYKPDHVHHHANFALYIGGQRDEFKSFTFYEEVQACSASSDNPKNRVHMHNQENGIIHVHDAGATWGHFFANLGYGLTDKVLQTDEKVFIDDQDGNQLSFILNGKPVETVANQVIESEDALLINYGKDSSETLQQRYETVPNDAGEYNHKPDPSGCGAGAAPTFSERLKAALGLSNTAGH